MRKNIALLLVMMLAVGIFASGCAGSEPATDEPKSEESAEAPSSSSSEQTFVTVATGGSSGVYFALGGALSNLLNENLDGINASAQSTGASAVNSTLLGTEKVEVAFAMNDVVSYAYTGTEVFKDKGKVENLRGIASLYPNFVQVITLEDTGITEISELKGKRVGVGAPGSGTEVNARQILGAHGITYDDIDEDFLSYAEAVEQLKNGAVDAAFLTSGLPNATIMDIATTHDVKIIPIRSQNVEELASEFPFYSSEVIPAGTYDNEEDVETAAVMTLLVTREDLSEDLVYNITKTMFENLDTLVSTHSAAKKITLDTVKKGMPIPLHPGAEKYFTEQGK